MPSSSPSSCRGRSSEKLYFHAPLPNTYYAKIYGIPLSWRLHNGLLYWKIYLKLAPYPVELLALVAAAQLLRRRVSRLSLALWLWLAIMALYIVTTGGDHMFAARFMVDAGAGARGGHRPRPLATGTHSARPRSPPPSRSSSS